ncbi:MAG: YqgE/AlgH family protein [Burkholderiales bacterium]|nr:YqgE/AlgH family protein [Burkholderiales bacterium]
MKLSQLLIIAACFALPGAAGTAVAQTSHPDAVLLVAAPGLRDAEYRQSVVLAVPVEGDRHVGVIINRPTKRTLASLFPEHAPSKRVEEPVFFGGPMSRGALVAVVRSSKDLGRGSIELLPQTYLAMTISIVDRVIEDTPNDARYYVGYVVWRPGELRAELDRKVWTVVNASSDLVFRKDMSGLWEELSRLSRMITASAHALEPVPVALR